MRLSVASTGGGGGSGGSVFEAARLSAM